MHCVVNRGFRALLQFKDLAQPYLVRSRGTAFANITIPPFKVFDLHDGFDPEPYIDLCRNPKGVADALGLLSAICNDTRRLTAGAHRALYVVGVDDDPIAKIGISANPISRLVDLQQNHYKELFLHSVYFIPKGSAEKLEKASISDAFDCGVGIRGEWVGEWPHEAAARILRTARAQRIGVCDGASWLNATLARTRETARGLKADREYRTR